MATLRALLGDDLQRRPRHGRIRMAGRFVAFPPKAADLVRTSRRRSRRVSPRHGHEPVPPTRGRHVRGGRARLARSDDDRPVLRAVRREALRCTGDRSRGRACASPGRCEVARRARAASRAPESRPRASSSIRAAATARSPKCSPTPRRRPVPRSSRVPRCRRSTRTGSTTGDGGRSRRRNGVVDAATRVGRPARLGARRRACRGRPTRNPRAPARVSGAPDTAGGRSTTRTISRKPMSRSAASPSCKNYRDSADDPRDVTVLCAEVPCALGDDRWNETSEELAAQVRDAIARGDTRDSDTNRRRGAPCAARVSHLPARLRAAVCGTRRVGGVATQLLALRPPGAFCPRQHPSRAGDGVGRGRRPPKVAPSTSELGTGPRRVRVARRRRLNR